VPSRTSADDAKTPNVAWRALQAEAHFTFSCEKPSFALIGVWSWRRVFLEVVVWRRPRPGVRGPFRRRHAHSYAAATPFLSSDEPPPHAVSARSAATRLRARKRPLPRPETPFVKDIVENYSSGC